MGLVSGVNNNVKKACKEMFSNTYREYATLYEARAGLGKGSDKVVVVLDGNVLMQSVPTEVWSLGGYVDVFERNVNKAFAAGDTVIVVFDEKVTRAKQAEQERRDAARKKSQPVMSEDLQFEFCPTNDDYTKEQLVDHNTNVHNLMAHRRARGRLFDIIVRDVLRRFEAKQKQSIKKKNDDGAAADRVLIFDGVDERGGDRPTDAPRATGIVASDARFENWLERKEGEKVGEGDVKLTHVQCQIENIKSQGKAFKKVELVLLCTIDTDVIGTELVRVAVDRYKERVPSFDTAFVIHERPQPVSKKRKAEDPDAEPTPGVFVCFHSRLLYEAVCKSLFGQEVKKMKALQPHAVLLLVGMFVLGHSDFVELKGLRTEVSFDAMAEICGGDVGKLQAMGPLLSVMAKGKFTTGAELVKATRESEKAIDACIEACIDILRATPRLGIAVRNASARVPEHNKRATWVLLYWGLFPEHAMDLDQFGFGVMI